MMQHLFEYLSAYVNANLVRDEQGQELVQYGILLGLIALVLLLVAATYTAGLGSNIVLPH